jgi:hypothetical protein
MAMCDYHLCAVCGGKAFYDTSCADDYYLGMVERGSIRALCWECEQHGYKLVVIYEPGPESDK